MLEINKAKQNSKLNVVCLLTCSAYLEFLAPLVSNAPFFFHSPSIFPGAQWSSTSQKEPIHLHVNLNQHVILVALECEASSLNVEC